MSKGILVGGWEDPRPADGEISMLSSWMWNISEATTNRKFNEFKAVEYRTQVVAGVNYVIKVQVGENNFIHLQIFQSPLMGNTIEIKFEGAQDGYKRDDPLEPFTPFV
ncbi:cystatin-A-like isoform X1 [Xiphophorus maculatus]|uniref:cystatin-A-like isoform X1 n=1 Tax=Xiphophorus maculatus TaxID=8083 RepID=UPI0003B4FB25|nr:cystatin-A-like isoform X1 [Xiphophorus maculatus]